jgi:predicted transposase YbfD/YdcC
LVSKFVCKVFDHFEILTDRRVPRETNHALVDMIFIALCAAICDANSWVDVERFAKAKENWLRRYIKLPNGIPSHDTFSRVFARLNTEEFYRCLQAWAMELAGCLRGESVALDGKTLRGSFDKAADQSALHSVSAWACGLRLCLGVESVDGKSNEIPAAQKLIEMLELEGAVVTGDAMHCQKKTCQAILDKHANYLFFVRRNQPGLHEAIVDYFVQAIDDPARSQKIRRQSCEETNRSRHEVRQTQVIACPKDHEVFSQWPGIKTLGQVYRERDVDGRIEEELVTFITSRPPKVRELSQRARKHWGIENSQHYILDVTFQEDASRIRKGSGPEVSSVFRRLALSILQKDTSIKDNIRGKRKMCAWCERTFDRLLAAF